MGNYVAGGDGGAVGGDTVGGLIKGAVGRQVPDFQGQHRVFHVAGGERQHLGRVFDGVGQRRPGGGPGLGPHRLAG